MKKYIFVSLLLAVLLVVPVVAQTITLEQIIQALQANPTLLTQVRLAIQQLTIQPQPPVGCYEFRRNFYETEKSDDATRVKEILSEEDVSDVKAFQVKYSISNTGLVGPLTRAKLNELSSARCKSFITPTELGNAKVGERYDRQLVVHRLNGLSGDISWSVTNGQLPSSLNLSKLSCMPDLACPSNYASLANISGWPTIAGTYTFTVQATNGMQTATQKYTLVVKDKDGNSQAPVISGISGPATLNVGQQGTWKINASDPNNKTLSYRVEWGDEPVVTYNAGATLPPTEVKYQQTATFTHVYNQAKTFSPTFFVSSAGGISQSSLSVSVGQVNPSTITVLSPNGGEEWTMKSVKTIKWFASGMEVDRAPKVDLYLDSYWCASGSICPTYSPPLIVLDKNISGPSYNWIVATDIVNNPIPVGKYRVKVCAAGDFGVCDSSDQQFTITAVANSRYDLNNDGRVDNSDLIWYRVNVISKYDYTGDISADTSDMQVISDHLNLLGKYDFDGSGNVDNSDLIWYRVQVIGKYDLTGDSRIDNSDLIEIRKYVGSVDLKYDFNGSGAVNSQDLLWFQANVMNKYDLTDDGGITAEDMNVVQIYIQNGDKYDLNGSGRVDSSDLIWYRTNVIGKYDYTSDQKCNADDLIVIQNNRG